MTSAPLSLYLELERDRIADLEVVAKASLAFVAAIKEVAYQIDPLLEIRVELESGEKGSLELKARIKGFKQKYLNRNVLLGVAGVVLIYFKDEIRDHVVDKALDAIIPGFSNENFSDTEKLELEQIINDALKKYLGKKEAAQVYRELEKDPAVKGVGATITPGIKPSGIVPRSDFKRRAGDAPLIESEIRRRESDPTLTVTLIKPVLEHSKRSWRLKAGDAEFGAIMEDQDFLDDVLSERKKIPMVEGVQLSVTLHIEEEFSSLGIWEVKSRKITKVHGFSRGPTQSSLQFLPKLRPSVYDDEDENR